MTIDTPAERARKAQSLVLSRMAATTQASLAAAMGVSESKVTRIKGEQLEDVLLLVTHLGLKLVPSDYKCVDSDAYAFLTKTHQRVMEKAPHLIWDQAE